jgi:hypothetical protein
MRRERQRKGTERSQKKKRERKETELSGLEETRESSRRKKFRRGRDEGRG